MRPSIITTASLLGLATAGPYIWPSPQDEIEDILSLQSGYLGRNFVAGVTPCLQGGNIKGRQNAAEWIRTAFHDMITHDAATGSGGLDGSVWFELDRNENAGLAFNNTFNFFNYLYSARASAADLLAMSVVVSHSGCGGDARIPFRSGRVDAFAAGPAGVPEADTPIGDTMARFAKAGLSQKDMIQLVACGHTLGGVHSANSPQIVEGDTNMYNDTVVTFDASPEKFDNRIAKEYVYGVTKNPLVVGRNDSFNSDKRIFSSDGNKTIAELACHSATFDAACAAIFTRMIDTVAKDVALSDPIEAFDIKPYVVELSLGTQGQLNFTGRVRVRTTAGLRDATDLRVHLALASRSGAALSTVEAEHAGNSAGLYGETFAFYEFQTTVDAAAGLSGFDIHLTIPSTGKTEVFRNDGSGYPLDDSLLFQKAASCVSRTSTGGFRTAIVTAAVRKDKAAETLSLDVVRIERRQGVIVRALEVERLEFQTTGEEIGDWVLFELPLQLASSAWSTSYDIVQGGDQGSRIDFIRTELCPRT
ncbi:heme peroxidase [Plectosphaerella plurivora]|uniref:Peroxidase n=1 Tax=Plectosphaerella plurivora TaxID=936078 RepID=A0A9P8V2Q4_9PEZI|nr:heme peroxidase [Plectosphaerella plurivora]